MNNCGGGITCPHFCDPLLPMLNERVRRLFREFFINQTNRQLRRGGKTLAGFELEQVAGLDWYTQLVTPA